MRAYKSFFTEYFVELLNNTDKDDATIHRYEIENHNWNALFKLYFEYVDNYTLHAAEPLLEYIHLSAKEAIAIVIGYTNGLFPRTIYMKAVILQLLLTHEHASVIHQMLGEVSSLLIDELLLDLYEMGCGRTADHKMVQELNLLTCTQTCGTLCLIAMKYSLSTLHCMKLACMCCLCTIAQLWYSTSFSHFMLIIIFLLIILFACYKTLVSCIVVK